MLGWAQVYEVEATSVLEAQLWSILEEVSLRLL